MIRLWKGYGIKLIGVLLITLSVFSIFYETSLFNLIVMGIVIATVSYIGDVFLLPKMNHVLAAVGDLFAYFALFWILSTLFITDGMVSILPAFMAAYLATAAEAVFHIYMIDHILDDDDAVMIGDFQTEIAEEETIDEDLKEKE